MKNGAMSYHAAEKDKYYIRSTVLGPYVLNRHCHSAAHDESLHELNDWRGYETRLFRWALGEYSKLSGRYSRDRSECIRVNGGMDKTSLLVAEKNHDE